MRVKVLGCGEAFAAGGRFQTCFLVDLQGFRFLLDCGATALVALQKYSIDPLSVDAVVISHLHGDHFGGLPFLDRFFHARARPRPLVVWGPPLLRERFEAALAALYPGSGRRYELELHSYSREFQLGGARFTTVPVDHDELTNPHGLKIRAAGRTLAFSGDTAWTDSLLELSQGSNVFICECGLAEPGRPKHVALSQLRQERGRLGCGRLLLTHLGQEMQELLPLEDFEVLEDGQEFSV
ncbi:MBL fold metallo-hydrolase [bacterium]|nr:MBL fold metallo-hydrolase [bacterium]